MTTAIKTVDAKGRVVLPGFANATVIVEFVSDSEYRVRKARVIPEDECHFPEEDMPIKLSERDAKKLIEMIENPPKPNAALRRCQEIYEKIRQIIEKRLIEGGVVRNGKP